jgi:hypothetical protein
MTDCGDTVLTVEIDLGDDCSGGGTLSLQLL